MTRIRAEELLLISTMVRNGVFFVVLVVLAVFMLYEVLSPADELPAAKDTSGGIPVIGLSSTRLQTTN